VADSVEAMSKHRKS